MTMTMNKFLLEYPHGGVGTVACDTLAEAAELAYKTASGPIPATPVEYMPVAEHLSAIDKAQAMIGAAELAAIKARAELKGLRDALDKIAGKIAEEIASTRQDGLDRIREEIAEAQCLSSLS